MNDGIDDERAPRGDSDRLPITYLLPIRVADGAAADDLTAYLDWLARRVEVIVVDASPDATLERHEREWAGIARHVRPAPELRSLNGKAWGVNTGLRLATHDLVIIADDDVRYDAASLAQVVDRSALADVIRPQNYFAPLPWHAWWDSGRILLNRALGGDWPGTIVVRRRFLPRGYDGDVLFENLELVRTAVAAGAVPAMAHDVYVRRLPPTSPHFGAQRVRQAYDEFARPARLAVQLALLPALAILILTRRWRSLAAGAVATMALAMAGRGRAGGGRYFPRVTVFAAPLWIVERAICAWVALGSRVACGGVPYAGRVLARAASSERTLRQRAREHSVARTRRAPYRGQASAIGRPVR